MMVNWGYGHFDRRMRPPMRYKMIFQDSEHPLHNIIEQTKETPLEICPDEVREEGLPKASAREIWSPQLLPYENWVPQQTFGDREEVGLLEAGSLGLGLDQDLREATLARAMHKQALTDAHEHAAAENSDTPKPLLSVRLDEEGYAIMGVDLHAYEHRCEKKVADTVVVIPRSIKGIPVVRITAGAFARRLVYGIDVRALIVPDSVIYIERDALAALSVHDIFISRSVKHLGAQRFSIKKATCIPDHIAFHVDPENPWFASCDGSLYSKMKDQLYFQAFPAPRTLTLPDGLRRIAPHAFVESAQTPELVCCPPTLAHIDSTPNQETLWTCALDSPLRRTFSNLHLSALSPHYLYKEGFYFDIMDSDEVHLVRSPRQCAHVVLPSSIEGRTLTRIRSGALPHRVESLVIPDSVTVIEAKNTCVGLTHLTLPAHLQTLGAHNFLSRSLTHTVEIPVSLTSIGRGCFENCICHFEASNATVHISPNLQLSCFIGEDAPAEDTELYEREKIPFDFKRYDELLASNKYLYEKTDAVLQRIEHPYRLSVTARGELLVYLQEHERDVMHRAARAGSPKLLESLCECGFITADTIDAQTEILRQMRKTDCVLFLMDYRQQHFKAAIAAPSSRFAL
ncbi:MAG: leucine-rich repeat domain-containing protein [Raoultibacter sp.]